MRYKAYVRSTSEACDSNLAGIRPHHDRRLREQYMHIIGSFSSILIRSSHGYKFVDMQTLDESLTDA